MEDMKAPAGYCGECGAWCEEDTLCGDSWCPTLTWEDDEDF